MTTYPKMKGGEALSQLLKNVQGKKSGSDSVNTIILGFLVFAVIAVLVGTFYMVKSLKSDKDYPAVVATPTTTPTTTDPLVALSSQGLGTQQQPLIQKQADPEGPFITSPLSGSGLFNVSTQAQDPSDPYAKMQVIGTVSILGTNQIRALGDGALESAYSGQSDVISKIKKPASEEGDYQFSVNQRYFLLGKRVRGNWFYYLTDQNKDAPTIPMYINGRSCIDPNTTGCPQLFENTYYTVDRRMAIYFNNLEKIVNNEIQRNLMRMLVELKPIVY